MENTGEPRQQPRVHLARYLLPLPGEASHQMHSCLGLEGVLEYLQSFYRAEISFQQIVEA